MRLPNRVGRRAVHTHRYEKQEPGRHVQVDAKFLSMQGMRGPQIRRYQDTAIDDATRVRALKIYARHTRANAIRFLDYVVEKCPFRIHTVRTDRGHGVQAPFHWHLADQGIRHVYIKARAPQLKGRALAPNGSGGSTTVAEGSLARADESPTDLPDAGTVPKIPERARFW